MPAIFNFVWRTSLKKEYCKISIYKSIPATTRDSREIIKTSLEDKSRIEKKQVWLQHCSWCFWLCPVWFSRNMILMHDTLLISFNMLDEYDLKEVFLAKTHWCSQHNEYCFGRSLKIKRGSLSRNFSAVRNNLKNEKK